MIKEKLYPELTIKSAKELLDAGNGYLARIKLETEYDDLTQAELVYKELRQIAVEDVVFSGDMELEEAERFFPSWEMAVIDPESVPKVKVLEEIEAPVHFPTDHEIDNALEKIDARIASAEKKPASGTPDAASSPKSSKGIDQDPYLRRQFAGKLMAYQEDILGICWDMKEHLEAARPYMNGSPTFLTLIEQTIGMTAEVQKLADAIRIMGEQEGRHADYLIHMIENPFSK